MKRGEVWWANLDPSVGGESRKTRPAIITSNNAANKHLSRVQVVSLTTKVDCVYPSEALVMFTGQEGKALADQLITVSKLRPEYRAGNLTGSEMDLVKQAIMMQPLKTSLSFMRRFEQPLLGHQFR